MHGVGLAQTTIRRRRLVKFARILNSTHGRERYRDRFSTRIKKCALPKLANQPGVKLCTERSGYTACSTIAMSLIVVPDDAPPVLAPSDAVTQLRDCEHRIYPT